MSRPPLEVADLIRNAGAAFIERNRHWLSWKHVKVLRAIAHCRTAALGGHLKSNGDPGWLVLGRGMHDLLLLELGCAYGQGNWFSVPLPADEFERLL